MKRTIIILFVLFPIFVFSQIKLNHITNDNLPNSAQFGSYVAMNEDYAAVGSFFHNSEKGLVTIYKRDGDEWVFSQNIAPGDLEIGDWFGFGLSMSDKYLVVGAPKDHWSTTEVGKSYVYELINGEWELDGVLTPSSAVFSESGFGITSIIYGEEVFVSAPDHGFMQTGAVVSFKKTGDNWEEQTTFISPGEESEISFGRSMSVNDQWLALSSVVREDGPVRQVIFLYSRVEDGWEHQETIDVPGTNLIVQIPAFSVDLSGNQLLVGNYMPPSQDVGLGGIYVYAYSGNEWLLEQTIEPEGFDMQETGRQIAQSDRFAMVGVHDFDGNLQDPHHMLIYDKSETNNWTLLEDFAFSESSSLSWQGFVIDMAGDFGIIGTSNGLNSAGDVYIFDFRNAISTSLDLSFEELDVYPNPFSDEVHIHSNIEDTAFFKLYNMEGQTLLNGPIIKLNQEGYLSHLPSGIYHLQVCTNDQNYYKKLVKN